MSLYIWLTSWVLVPSAQYRQTVVENTKMAVFLTNIELKCGEVEAGSPSLQQFLTCATWQLHKLPSSLCFADWQRNGVQAFSPHGEENHTLWHGCRRHLQVRSCWLSGPLHQVSVWAFISGSQGWQIESVSEAYFPSECRVFNISNGKQKKLYKGSVSEDGSLLRVKLPFSLQRPSFSLFL